LNRDGFGLGYVRDRSDQATLPLKIDTMDHEPWQVPGFPIPKALKETVNKMLKERMRNGILEPCQGPYRNPWFIVKKKDRNY